MKARTVVLPDYAVALASGRVHFDPAKAKECLDATAALTCDALAYDPVPATCTAVFIGNVGTGGACYHDMDCVSTACDTSGPTCPGKCVAVAAVGADCDIAVPCAQTGAVNCINGKCVGPVDEGGACGSSGGACRAPLVCTNGTCVQRPAPGALGARCDDYVSRCAAGLYCPYHSSNTPVCTAVVPLGGACSDFDDDYGGGSGECTPGLVCKGLVANSAGKAIVAGSCQPRAGVGETCAISTSSLTLSGCYNALSCPSGVCTPPTLVRGKTCWCGDSPTLRARSAARAPTAARADRSSCLAGHARASGAPNSRSASITRDALLGLASIQMSRSFVARGRPCRATA